MPVVVIEWAAEAHEMTHPDSLDLTDHPGVNDLLHDPEHGHVPHVEAHHEALPGPLPGFEDPIAPLDGDCQRLFTEDVLTCFQSCYGVFLMAVVRAGDRYCIHIIAGEHLTVVCGNEGAKLILPTEILQEILSSIGTGDDYRAPVGLVPVEIGRAHV